MKTSIALLFLIVAITAGASRNARAALWNVDCVGNPSTALGSILGTPTTAGQAADGDIVLITGLCTEDVRVTQSGLIIENATGFAGFVANDGISGQFEIDGGTRDVVQGVLLGWPTAGSSFASDNDKANVQIHSGGTLTILNCEILNGPRDGLAVSGRSWAQLLGTLVSGNGTAALSHADFGIGIADGAVLVLGNADGSDGVTVSGNLGAGLVVTHRASLEADAAVIAGNGGGQLALLGGANAHLGAASLICAGTASAESCAPASSGLPAITLRASSSIRIDAGAAVTGPDAGQALLVAGSSSAVLQGSVFAARSSGAAVIEATSGSAIDLAGGNLICAGAVSGGACDGSGSLAFQLDHVSNLLQVAPAVYGYPAVADIISGGGLVNEQSNADLGVGTATLSWTTGPTNLLVQQNSSFRLSGGAAVIGQLVFEQGSNGFFNTVNGGGNSVSGVSCLFGLVPASHISQGGSQSLSPATQTTAVPAAGSNQCMSF